MNKLNIKDLDVMNLYIGGIVVLALKGLGVWLNGKHENSNDTEQPEYKQTSEVFINDIMNINITIDSGDLTSHSSTNTTESYIEGFRKYNW